MDDLFSKVLVINMDGEEDRYRSVCERLRATGTTRIDRVGAVDGKKLTESDKEALCTGYCRAMCTPSMVGCFLSHRKCWQRCVDEGLPNVLIVEDDAIFTEHALEGARTAVRELPPAWAMLYLGCFTCSDDDTTTEDASIARMLYPHRSPQKKTEHLWKPSMIFGMHAYAVSFAGARQLLELMPRASNHVDWALSEHLDELDVYALRPGVAFQTGMDTSSMGSKAPVFLNKVLAHIPLGVHKQDGRTLAWQFSEAWVKLGWNSVVVNKWFMIFLGMSLLGFHKAALVIVATDFALALATSDKVRRSFFTGYVSLIVAIGLGTSVHFLVAGPLLKRTSYAP